MTFIDSVKSFGFKKLVQTTEAKGEKGFRTFYGVYLPSVLSIFGVIMYLRLGWIVGNIGVFQTLIIIFFSSMITFITGLSISATATNMQIGGGGAYYMISRSFGPELGSAIGVFLFLSQATAIAFYIEGFAESIHTFIPVTNPVIVEMTALAVLTILICYSANVALKAQFIIFILIILTLISILATRGVSVEYAAGEAFSQGMSNLPFWGAFALFFPAVTGIEAGISMSGDLKDPRRSLPLGTLAAVITGFLIYSLLAINIGSKFPKSILTTDYLFLQNYTALPLLIVLGVWGATLSSALGGLLGAPRTLQALSNDGIIPSFLGKGYGELKEPRIASCVTFCIGVITLYYGNINLISSILSMFFLMSYGMLNLAAGLESLLGNPSWRPTFRIHWATSFLGAFLCLFAMLMINTLAAFTALLMIAMFYVIMKRRKVSKGWEDIRQGILMFFSRFAIYRLASLRPTARSWRPNFLVFTGSPARRPYLLRFADSITKNKGFLTTATIFTTGEAATHSKTKKLEDTIREYLYKNKIQALVEVEFGDNFFSGIKKIINNYGMGPIAPNTIVLGDCAKLDDIHSYVPLIFCAKAAGKNVVIIKEEEKKIADSGNTIDIWWDDESRKNSEFIIVLAHMLQADSLWKNHIIEIKSTVPHESAREMRMEYFMNFFTESRIKVNSKVLVLDEKEESAAETFKKFSGKSSLVFLSLRPPREGESIEDYSKFYLDLMKKTKALSHVAFVMSIEEIELKNIFL